MAYISMDDAPSPEPAPHAMPISFSSIASLMAALLCLIGFSAGTLVGFLAQSLLWGVGATALYLIALAALLYLARRDKHANDRKAQAPRI